ncbi:DUF2589 domain-containing protein [Blastococcus sp. SYSU D00922]
MAEPVSGTARLIEDYLGSTLGSLVKAQGLLSSQLAEFIERVGFEPPEDDDGAPLRARTFSFAFERTEVGEGDELVTRRVTASLPLLSIVSLPSLAIDAADVQMDLRIVATEAPPEPPQPEPRPPGRPPGGPLIPPVRPPLRMWAIPVRPAPLPPLGRPASPDAATIGSIRVSVTLRRLELPLGLERVERLLNEGYREEFDDG